jgi:hypothetical protein
MKTTAELTRSCPFPNCDSHLPGRPTRIVRHSWLHLRSGRRRRLHCKTCRRTFVATLGTAYYRMRRSAGEFDAVIKLSAEGVSQAAIARARSLDPSTVSRWTARAAGHAQRFTDEHLRVAEPVELQLDELRTNGVRPLEHTWVFNSIEVWTRVWTATRVATRTLRNTLLFVRETRRSCGVISVPPLITSDEFKYYEQVIKRTFGPLCVYVQVDNRYQRGRLVRSKATRVLGTAEGFERARARSEDSQRPNTSYVERLNLFVRRSCAYLNRRTPAPTRKSSCLASSLEILRCYYNFIRPHSSLRAGNQRRTPAMQAGIFKRPLTFREIFGWVPPPAAKHPVLSFRA